jgi:hypothetical protein
MRVSEARRLLEEADMHKGGHQPAMAHSTAARRRCFLRNPMPIKLFAIALWAAMSSAPALAEEVSGRRITSVGCHAEGGTCFVSLDGPAFGGSLGCTTGASNQFRWDSADTANGRRTHATMRQPTCKTSASPCSLWAAARRELRA